MQAPVIRNAISALGTDIGPEAREKSEALFEAEQHLLAERVPPHARDIAYGPDERHRLDLYGAVGATPKAVVLFVHGGGFSRGDKGGGSSWPNAAVGRWLAEAGLIGAVMNYRLAPNHSWPAGSVDVGRAVEWLRRQGADYGVDPRRVVLMGTSAGAVHVAGYLAGETDSLVRVCGAVMLSGLYGYTPLDPPDQAYYGAPEAYPARMPRLGLVGTEVPLFVACAEFDPPRFQAEFVGLLAERLERHARLPRACIASGHNHYSIAMHLGTSDRRLSQEILDFIADITSQGTP